MVAALSAACAMGSPHAADGLAFLELKPGKPDWTFFTPYSKAEVYTLPIADPGFEWDELVVSWNVEGGEGVQFEARAKALFADGSETPLVSFGLWSLDRKMKRESMKGQSGEWGKVDTDTLILKKPAWKVQIQLSLTVPTPVQDPASGPKGRESNSEGRSPGIEAAALHQEALKGRDGSLPRIKLLGLSFRNSKTKPKYEDPNRAAWGRTIEVPRRSQMSYPGGDVLCSPTAVSMVLAHWAKELKRPDLERDVPEVQAGVFDPNWPGTGNWPFNTAYAGSFPGMTAYVTRFGSVREVEDWIEAGIPVVASVSSALLKGRPKKEPNDGHLVVVVGFTKDGDPVFNDPGRSVEIRQIYKREHFAKAWETSGRTVYLICPESKAPPKNRLGHWLTSPPPFCPELAEGQKGEGAGG